MSLDMLSGGVHPWDGVERPPMVVGLVDEHKFVDDAAKIEDTGPAEMLDPVAVETTTATPRQEAAPAVGSVILHGVQF